MVACAQALWLWKRGLSVVPVPPPGARSDGKRPVIAWKSYQERRPTEQEIRAWFRTEQNIAVVTGAVSDIVVVDADSREAAIWVRHHLTPTPWIVRTSKGYHLYYRHPGGRVPNRARIETGAGKLALDVRGDGGFVIGPGSVHASGVVYRAVGDWSRPVRWLPLFQRGLLSKRPERRAGPWRRPGARATGPLVDRARRYLLKVPRPVEGRGSDLATFKAACKVVRGFGVEEEVAVELLCEWAPHFDAWWIARKVLAAARYGSEPIGKMR